MTGTHHDSILNELHYRMEELPRALGRIARYILTNPEKVIHQSIVDLAHYSQSGQASVLRLVKDLGFAGFSEFKLQLNAELARRPTVRDSDGSAPQVTAVSVCRNGVADLDATCELLAVSPVEEVVERIRSSRRIDIFGSGLSGICGEILNYRLLRLGLNSQAFRDPTLAHELAGRLDSSSTAIAISDSGTTPSTVQFLRSARAAGAFAVAISSRRSSALADHAEALLQTGSTGGADEAGNILGVVVRASAVTEVLGQLLEQGASGKSS